VERLPDDFPPSIGPGRGAPEAADPFPIERTEVGLAAIGAGEKRRYTFPRRYVVSLGGSPRPVTYATLGLYGRFDRSLPAAVAGEFELRCPPTGEVLWRDTLVLDPARRSGPTVSTHPRVPRAEPGPTATYEASPVRFDSNFYSRSELQGALDLIQIGPLPDLLDPGSACLRRVVDGGSVAALLTVTPSREAAVEADVDAFWSEPIERVVPLKVLALPLHPDEAAPRGF
jgi:hypothetical protein